MPSKELIELGEERREQIMAFIREYRVEHGYSPSIRECAADVDLSINATSRHLDRLVDDGSLRKTPNVQRSLVPAEEVGG